MRLSWNRAILDFPIKKPSIFGVPPWLWKASRPRRPDTIRHLLQQGGLGDLAKRRNAGGFHRNKTYRGFLLPLVYTVSIIYIYIYTYWLVVPTPLKNFSQLGWLFPIYGKIKNVPNHQPVYVGIVFYQLYIPLDILIILLYFHQAIVRSMISRLINYIYIYIQ